ncbi:MAG TPA: adenine DNA glycosylase [Leucothrix sp.]|nr:adenine DNA glycosylase [Leucothrix sp.]
MVKEFSEKLLHWYDQYGRKNLPWQQDINPYRVWVSEIMLQQTQVKTVIPYYQKFMTTFPNVQTLANAEQDTVLKHWSGLGYYARARNMHKAAKLVCDDFSGAFPNELEAMQSLPGIGRSTAAAILSISGNQKQAILDGNVKRVISRVFAIEGWSGKSSVLKIMWKLVEQLVPDQRNADYTQAIMDLGATLCTRSKPQCENCPFQDDCLAYQQGIIENFPAKKPRKILPERYAVMLIIQDHNKAVFMQKRPPVGIWGGLWCFPQFEDEVLAQEWLRKKFSFRAHETLLKGEKQEQLIHVFSHFRLTIQPIILGLDKLLNSASKTPFKERVMETDDSLWYNIDSEFNGGLASPVQTLLNKLK